MANSTVKQIYLIRHGETEPNRNHIIQGSGLDAPLNKKGQKQANDFFSAYKHIPFDAIFTSALIRTHQSVSRFLEADIPHFALSQLNEISWGVKDGTKIDPTEQIIYNALLGDWQAGLLDRRFDLGESPNMVATRIKVAISEIESCAFKTILLCIHGRALRIFLCTVFKIPLTRMEEVFHSNLCLYILEFDGSDWSLKLRNDTSHLFY